MCLNSYYYYHYIIEAQLTPIIYQYFNLRNHKLCRNLHPTLANLPNTFQQLHLCSHLSTIIKQSFELLQPSTQFRTRVFTIATYRQSLFGAHHSIDLYSYTYWSVIFTFFFRVVLPFHFGFICHVYSGLCSKFQTSSEELKAISHRAIQGPHTSSRAIQGPRTLSLSNIDREIKRKDRRRSTRIAALHMIN